MHWLDALNLWLNQHFSDPQWLFWTFTLGLGTLAFLLFNLLFSYLRSRFNPVKERIEAFATDPGRVDIGGAQLDQKARGQRLLERIGRGFTAGDPEREDGPAFRLAQVGFRSPRDLHIFTSLKILAALALPLITAAVLIGGGLMPLRLALPIIALTLFLGAILPDYWLTQLVKAHQAALRRALPDVLDMLVVCSEAGLGLNAAIQRVALEMDIQYPAMADELKTTMLQMGAGMDNRTALQELARRTGIEEMRSLVATLQQAMRFGTSISDTLRAYSGDMRNKRLENAQEKAAQASVKMLIPIAVTMLPALLFIVLGPPMLKLAASSFLG